MFFGIIARGYGLAAPFARLSRANLLALLIIGKPGLVRVCWVSFGVWLLGRSQCLPWSIIGTLYRILRTDDLISFMI